MFIIELMSGLDSFITMLIINTKLLKYICILLFNAIKH